MGIRPVAHAPKVRPEHWTAAVSPVRAPAMKLFVACLIGDRAESLVCRERRYYALAHDLMARREPDKARCSQ